MPSDKSTLVAILFIGVDIMAIGKERAGVWDARQLNPRPSTGG
ncbi:unnamed protein product [marine sediment metagenome]|uniref:Uncharacterized protein n=1 Tax=marine sediment metagenome TaxID=412755 RepID=X1Q5F6_9ZZZZ